MQAAIKTMKEARNYVIVIPTIFVECLKIILVRHRLIIAGKSEIIMLGIKMQQEYKNSCCFLWAKLRNNVFILGVNDYIILISMLLVFY